MGQKTAERSAYQSKQLSSKPEQTRFVAKRLLDKAASDAANYKRQLRKAQSRLQEQAADFVRMSDAYEQLKLQQKFLERGYPRETAQAMASAYREKNWNGLAQLQLQEFGRQWNLLMDILPAQIRDSGKEFPGTWQPESFEKGGKDTE